MVKLSRSSQQRGNSARRAAAASAAPQVGHSRTPRAGCRTATRELRTQHRDDLEVDQLGRGQLLGAKPAACGIPVTAVSPRRPRGRWRQRRARSPCTVLTASSNDTDPPDRSPARSRTSSTVGRLASAIRRERRYSCSDWCAAAARWRNTAWVFPGMSLI